MEGAQFPIYRSLAQPQTRIETMTGPKQIPGGTGWGVECQRGKGEVGLKSMLMRGYCWGNHHSVLLGTLQEALCNVPLKGKKSELSILQSSSETAKNDPCLILWVDSQGCN